MKGNKAKFRLKTIKESVSSVKEATLNDETLDRIDRLKEAYGDEFIMNLLMKLDDDTINNIIDTMERDMGMNNGEEEEEEEEEETE